MDRDQVDVVTTTERGHRRLVPRGHHVDTSHPSVAANTGATTRAPKPRPITPTRIVSPPHAKSSSPRVNHTDRERSAGYLQVLVAGAPLTRSANQAAMSLDDAVSSGSPWVAPGYRR